MSTEREVAEKLKEAIEKRNLDVFLPYLTDDMTYEVLPSTIGKKATKEEWKGNMGGILAAVESAELELVKVIECPLFVVAQANVTLNFPGDPFTQEILLLFNFVRDGKGALKITGITEYIDSLKVKEWKAKRASAPPSS